MRLVLLRGTRRPWFLLFLLACAASWPQGLAQNLGQAVRVVQGIVRDSGDQPQANVYGSEQRRDHHEQA